MRPKPVVNFTGFGGFATIAEGAAQKIQSGLRKCITSIFRDEVRQVFDRVHVGAFTVESFGDAKFRLDTARLFAAGIV